ncbi:MAG: hypothetical protein FJ335_10095 [Sphingomonadales bacterium]|nr:hypothetical protein [Sphingomonadales bacterium]
MSAVALQSFGFGEQLVRAFDRDGAAWFVGNDVCKALDIGNSRDALGRLEEDERGCVGITDAIGRTRETTIISESGVYALIFTSRKEAAKRFRRWVTQEVLPAIRTTGRFEIVPPEPANDVPFTAEMPDELDLLARKLAVAREARIVFGLKAARKAWRALGLLPGLTDAIPEEVAPQYAVPPAIAKLHQSVLDWLEARTEAAPGHREGAQELYSDYVDWAKAEGMTANEIETLSAFGRTLSNCGIGSIRSSRIFRVGLRLIDAD